MRSVSSPHSAKTSLLKCTLLTAAAALLVPVAKDASAQQIPAMQQMAQTAMRQWPDGDISTNRRPKGCNGLGILLAGMDAAWYDTANGGYYEYIHKSIDPLTQPDGSLSTLGSQLTAFDERTLGSQVLLLYRVTGQKRYYIAASLLRQQLQERAERSSSDSAQRQPFTSQNLGCSSFMAQAFFAEYSSLFQQPQDFQKITQSFVLSSKRMHATEAGPATGNKRTASLTPPHNTIGLQTLDMAWFMTALVATVPYYPGSDPGRDTLLAILRRTAATVVRYQDRRTGLWHKVLGRPRNDDKLSEPSAACLLTYALAKAVRLGYLPKTYDLNAQRAWHGIETNFLHISSSGAIVLDSAAQAVGPDKRPVAHSSHDRTISPAATNNPLSAGAFLLAGSEAQLLKIATLGAHQVVLVDGWYNSQEQRNAAGNPELFHYKWSDYSNSGFSLFGHMFRSYGIATRMLATAPTGAALRQAQYYIIVSPDNPAKNPNTHYMSEVDAKHIADWVRRGGVLLLMENDPANADIPHLDLLADVFGLHFNNRLTHAATEYDYAMGRIDVEPGKGLFHHAHTLYMKDTCSLTLTKDAVPLLFYKGDVFMATARYGKGTVYAVTDPWLYNEYTDGRKLPPKYDNFAAGMELVHWLINQRSTDALSSRHSR